MRNGHSQWTLVDGLWTHARVLGSGPPLVVVPGLGCASWMYERVGRHLARTRTVYLYDPPGHGDSQGRPGEPACIADLTDHLAAWLQASGLRCAPLFGHSLGGEVIFDLAARHPRCTTGLIACAPTGIPENPSVAAQLVRLLRDLPRERPGLWPGGLRAYGRAGSGTMYRLAHDQSQHHTGALLPHIRVPTLLLGGDRDPVIRGWTVEEIQRGIPHAVIRVIHGGTHALTDSHPRAVASYARDFLELLGDHHLHTGAQYDEALKQ